jgi:hypothetical protein
MFWAVAVKSSACSGWLYNTCSQHVCFITDWPRVLLLCVLYCYSRADLQQRWFLVYAHWPPQLHTAYPVTDA